jgi:hypothetical protein
LLSSFSSHPLFPEVHWVRKYIRWFFDPEFISIDVCRGGCLLAKQSENYYSLYSSESFIFLLFRAIVSSPVAKIADRPQWFVSLRSRTAAARPAAPEIAPD